MIDAVHETYQAGIWTGIVSRAAERGVQLISLIGTSQDGVDHFDTHYDLVSEFAAHGQLDGIVVFSGSIVEHHGAAFVETMCHRFGDVPVVCLSQAVGEFPCILVENGIGVEAMVTHFVQEHHLGKIAFITGPDGHTEAEERFAAYKRGLAANNVAFDPKRVVTGGFIQRDGEKAVHHLLENNIDFDSILAVGDHTALGAIAALVDMGKHVPGDVAVAGFDDVPEAGVGMPGLTTVRQPLFDMGMAAIDNIVAQIDGTAFEDRVILATEPVLRRSCGCFSRKIQDAKAVFRQVRGLSKEAICDDLLASISERVDPLADGYPGNDDISRQVNRLVESLILNVREPESRNVFLNQVDLLLFYVRGFSDSIDLMGVLLKHLTICVPSLFFDPDEIAEASNLLQQAQALVRDHEFSQQQVKASREKDVQLRINVASQRIISSFERRELLDSLREELPILGVNRFTMALFGEQGVLRNSWVYNPLRNSHLLVNTYESRTDYPRNSREVEASHLFPEELMSTGRSYNHLFMPLFFHKEYLGYILLEYVPDAPLFMYEELRLHIGSALKSSIMLRKFKTQSMTDEMTGLLNRRGFLHTAGVLLDNTHASGGRFYVFYADVDGLKKINDQYGHDDGDLIICGAATILRDTFRECDVIARLGGDEFVVSVATSPGVSLEARIQRRMDQNLERFNRHLNKPYSLRMSIGAAVFSSDSDTGLGDVMTRADQQLIAEKHKKKNRANTAKK